MRFAVPVNAADEVAVLAVAGASELYVGYQDAWWEQRYGNHDSASRRQGRANLSTRAELAAVVREARAHDLPVWLALNSRYTEAQLAYLVALSADFEAMGGTGIIASDLGLLWRLRTGHGLARCLSILAVAQNSATLRAYRQLGVTRVVLPRFMGPEEARRLLQGVPGVEGEFMAFFDKCPWVDGYCRHRHGITYAPREVAGGIDDAPRIYTFDTTYRAHACLGRACAYLEPYPCAACALPAFEAAGAAIAKLGGRGRPLDERLRALRFLRAAKGLATDEERRALYAQMFGRDCACYYGSAAQDRGAIEPVAHPAGLGGRCVLGSQTDCRSFGRALEWLCDGAAECGPLALLVPPLADEGIGHLSGALAAVDERYGNQLLICVNDLGTLTVLARERVESGYSFGLALGTLLARMDDAREVAHFLSPWENPPRTVWGPEGEPRVLAYREPPEDLVRHWERPSLLELSAQEALQALTGLACVSYGGVR